MKYAKMLVTLFVAAGLNLAVLLTWAPVICSGKDKDNATEKEAPPTPSLLPGFVSEGELRYEVGGTWDVRCWEEGAYRSVDGIAVARDGTVYVSALSVHRFAADGRPLGRWSGNPPGAFGRPVDVAVGPAGNVYVVDEYGETVQIFSAEGKYLGKCDGWFRSSPAVAVAPNGHVYVPIQGHEGFPELKYLDAAGVSLGIYWAESCWDWSSDVAVGADGTVYLAKSDPPRVKRLSAEAEEIGEIPLPYRGWEVVERYKPKIAVDTSGRLYALGGWFNDAKKAWRYKVSCIAPDGALADEWDPAARAGAEFAGATDIEVGPEGNLWIAAWASDNVHVFTPEGEFIRAWEVGGSGPGPEGRYGDKYGLCVAADGTAFVADGPARRIRRFGPGGDFLGAWGADGVFSLAGPLDAGPDGHVYLVDHDGPVLEFSAAGECVRVIPMPYGEGTGPGDVAVGADGDVFITYGDVFRYPADGSPGELFARGGRYLAVNAKGNVYVAGSEPPYIRRYSAEGKLLGEWGEAGSGAYTSPICTSSASRSLRRRVSLWPLSAGPASRRQSIYVPYSDDFCSTLPSPSLQTVTFT